MIFTSGAFLLFYLLVFGAYWLLRGREAQNWLLLLASQVFYAWWDWRFLGLMWLVIAICHAAVLLIEARWRPRLVLAAAIVLLLGVLSVFKYLDFLLGSLLALADAVGVHLSYPTLAIILPVGISFFVFEAICYVVDVYRRDLPADRSLLHSALYISFFPKMMAGPIIRASDFLPQLARPRMLTARDLQIGLKLFAVGFIYKAVFSDNVSPFVDGVFADVRGHDNHSLVMATVGFYAQIYFDFCGYSLMAIGVARTLGFHLPRNFNFPYIAASITDFWRRWHISLSTWLRDYLYIPLGGNRGGERKRERNLMLTMLLGGLWHGASWNFVLWGGLHGAALVLHKRLSGLLRRLGQGAVATLAWAVLGWAATQLFVLLAWIPFRAQGFGDSLQVFAAFTGLRPDQGLARAAIPYLAVILPVLLDTLALGMQSERRWLKAAPLRLPAWAVGLCLGAVLALLVMLMPMEVNNFIYFQF